MANLDNIKFWMRENSPDVLKNLNGPASESEIEKLQLATNLKLPTEYADFLKLHNGESGYYTEFFGDGNTLLNCDQILSEYEYQRENCEISHNDLIQFQLWKEKVNEGRLDVSGPVKPHQSHKLWLPITDMNGDVFRYIDFDPAKGGACGQIIEVDLESYRWKVIASSFMDLINMYWSDISNGKFEVDEHGAIRTKEEFWDETVSWVVPEWLLNIRDENPVNVQYNDADWHFELGNLPKVRKFLNSDFPIEMELNEWQDYEPSGIDPEFYAITGRTDDGWLFIAFTSFENFQDIAPKIKSRCKKMGRVKLRFKLKKHNDATDRKSHPSWRCWLEATDIERVRPFWKFW